MIAMANCVIPFGLATVVGLLFLHWLESKGVL